jgi:N6-adenosine-specific RNA methylase IME4
MNAIISASLGSKLSRCASQDSDFLIDIAARILIEHEAVATAFEDCLSHAIAAGELLLEAKNKVLRGQWLPWLGEHCRQVSERSAQGYMRLARNRAKVEQIRSHTADLTIDGALKALAAPTVALKSLETDEARSAAVEAMAGGTNIRTAVRGARKLDYAERVAGAKPKPLEGTYRIILADPPWKYHGLNQADEYGHAERHYDCLDDDDLCSYRPGAGEPTVKELADKHAVLFLWVTSPLLIRCAAIIEAWGFEYKASFVWHKVRHTMGHYNSVRHELLLVCTRGICTPDTGRLINSVQTIERSDRHSEKPQEFYGIIESMYDHGRKLELFARKPRHGWDSDGNESEAYAGKVAA